jgi:transcriptional regulator GlxA family with amidase domain
MVAHRSYRQMRDEIDTLLLAGGSAIEGDRTSPETVQWLRAAAASTRRIGSVCTGALPLARAGLLNGRRATTHWNWCQGLARRYPQIAVEPDPIFVRDSNVYTSAGVTAGMDLAP